MRPIWYVVITLMILYIPICMLCLKKYKDFESKKVYSKIKSNVKSDLNLSIDKYLKLKNHYPDITRLPLKTNMNWVKIMNNVKNYDKKIQRLVKETELGSF